jgi:ABC-type dipeptide/oligopeptide/nickel transport system ATPase subunit
MEPRVDDAMTAGNARPVVAVVMLTYNQAENTLRALASIGASTRATIRVVVWDNASTDDTVAQVRRRFPDVIVEWSADNLGVAGGRNAGAKLAIERFAPDYLCFLDNVRNQSVDTLSKGYRHRTCFAQSIIHDPDVLILDEPTDGLDPNQKHEVRGMIKRMGQNKAIIFSTHILEEVEAACSRAIIIDRGKVVADGTPDSLKKRCAFGAAPAPRSILMRSARRRWPTCTSPTP